MARLVFSIYTVLQHSYPHGGLPCWVVLFCHCHGSYIYASGAATESSLQTSGLNFSAYQCVDLQLILSAFRSAYFVDFGIVDRLWSLYVKQRLQLEGWDVVRPSIPHVSLGLHVHSLAGLAASKLLLLLYCRLAKPPPTFWSLQQQHPT